MEPTEREIVFYEGADGGVPARDWLERIESDKKIYSILMNRLDRVATGNFGDCKPVGDGVSELRVDFGPGYRIYYGIDREIIVLLFGGTKKTQTSDIAKAKRFWSDYNA